MCDISKNNHIFVVVKNMFPPKKLLGQKQHKNETLISKHVPSLTNEYFRLNLTDF